MSKILTSIFCVVVSVFFIATGLCFIGNTKMQSSFAVESTLYDNLLSNSNYVLMDKFEKLLIADGTEVTQDNFVDLLIDYCAEITSLDLNNVIMSGETDVALDSILELKYLNFPNLESLIASNNKISSIDKNIFVNMPKLKYINLSNNVINEIEVPVINNLVELQLQFNNISKIDISNVSSTAFVNLSHNNITSAENINVAMPTPTVFLLNNSISSTTAVYGKNFEYFMQSIPEQANEARVFQLSESIAYPELFVKFVNKVTNDEVILNQGEKTSLVVGNYTLKFYNGENLLDNGIFASKNIIIKKNAPKIQFFQNNKKIDLVTSLKRGVTINFSGDNNGGEWLIQYKVNNNEWISKSSLKLNNTGSYTISCRMVNGEQTSEVATIILKIDAQFSMTWAMIIVGLIVAIGVFVYLFKLKKS